MWPNSEREMGESVPRCGPFPAEDTQTNLRFSTLSPSNELIPDREKDSQILPEGGLNAAVWRKSWEPRPLIVR